MTPLVDMIDIDKSFPGVRALSRARFELMAGEVHALMGENGAGKSTLMKILSGVYSRDSGEVRLDANGLLALGTTLRALTLTATDMLALAPLLHL